MSDFKATHEFMGLELQKRNECGSARAEYVDRLGYLYTIPYAVVQKVTVSPQPGEVLKFYLYDLPEGFRVVDSEGNLRDINGTQVCDSDSFIEENYVKILNADGSPA